MKPLARRTTRLALTALASLACFSAMPAQAVGRLADIHVVDRDSGATLPVYRHLGEYWVAGRPGARYAVSVRNATGARVLGVVSVDGVNVVSGETASWEQTGYVLSPWQAFDITGWRKSDAEVAAFHFTASQASYAARTGRPDQVGVIGVAVFREKLPPPPPVAMPYAPPGALPEAQDRSMGPGRPRLPRPPRLLHRRPPNPGPTAWTPPVHAAARKPSPARRPPRAWAPAMASAKVPASSTRPSSAAAGSPTS